MDLGILNFGLVVPTVSKPCKTSSIEVDSERRIAGDKCIKPNIELFASNKERIIDIPLNYIRFS